MKYSNVDGGRINDGRYTAFKDDVTKALRIPDERVYTDPVKTFAYGRELADNPGGDIQVFFSLSSCISCPPSHLWCITHAEGESGL